MGLLVKTKILMESVPEYTYNCILINTIIELRIGQQQFGYGFMGALYYLGIEHYLAGIFQFITYTSLSVYIITGLYNGANCSTCFAGQASSNRIICKRQNSRMNKTLLLLLPLVEYLRKFVKSSYNSLYRCFRSVD